MIETKRQIQELKTLIDTTKSWTRPDATQNVRNGQ